MCNRNIAGRFVCSRERVKCVLLRLRVPRIPSKGSSYVDRLSYWPELGSRQTKKQTKVPTWKMVIRLRPGDWNEVHWYDTRNVFGHRLDGMSRGTTGVPWGTIRSKVTKNRTPLVSVRFRSVTDWRGLVPWNVIRNPGNTRPPTLPWTKDGCR